MKYIDSVTPKNITNPEPQDLGTEKISNYHTETNPLFQKPKSTETGGAEKHSIPDISIHKTDTKQNINLFSLTHKTKKIKNKKIWFLKFSVSIIVVLILLLGSLAALKALNISDKIFVGQKYSFFQKIKMAFVGAFGGGEILIGENLGQVNVLLLGIGGEGHEGPYLTDTIMLAQIKPDSGDVSLTSIPRDLLAALPNNLGRRKINAAFAEGYNRRKDYAEAGKWARETAEKITGMKIPYFAVIDFSGFEKAINKIGGLNIYVENSFSDNMFPNEKLGYLPTQTFNTGWEQMDGQRALIFARSRHGNNNEGSDFARSQRQEKIISAFKTKLLGLNLITDIGKINNLLNNFADHFHTNINPGELFRLYGIIRDKSNQKILSLSLDEETGIICPKILEENGAWVLDLCEGKNEKDLWNFFKDSPNLSKIKNEKAVVWLGTSTNDAKFFQKIFKELRSAGFTVWEVGFGGKEPVNQNLIYQVNQKPYTLEFIKQKTNALEVNLPPPGIKIDPNKVDIIIILGKNN